MVRSIVIPPYHGQSNTSPGVSDFTVNLDTQEVLVKGTLPYEDVLARIKKTGKEVGSYTQSGTLIYWNIGSLGYHCRVIHCAFVVSVLSCAYIATPI